MDRRRFLAAGVLLSGAAPAAADGDAWRRLQGGGHMLLIRHAATHPGVGDPPGFRLAACATQRNLSEQGKRDARELGAAIRERGIPVGPVLSSRWCRCLDTARLAFGRVEAVPMLDSIFRDSQAEARAKVREVLAMAAAYKDTPNLVLVTHDVNIRALVNAYVVQGEVVVARPARGKLEVVGRLRPQDFNVR